MSDMSEDLFQSVAIIGASGRFPGAADIASFWENIAAGVDSIEHFSEAELRARGVAEEMLGHPSYVKAGARMPGAEDFDPEFFDMTPREAEITDPQHRILLECAYEALENAGYVAHREPGAIALYAGVGLNTYLINNLLPREDVLRSLGMHQLLLGNDKCYATSRIAYKLNLRGPCMTVDTACSSSLVAIVLAYKSLISFDCDMALAGGAKVNAADNGYPYEAGSINSPDGRCRAFDAEARGTVFGSGAGIVVLKRLEDAVRDRDNIQAVIRGAAINNDGAAKVGFTAPSVTGQRSAIRQALAFAEVDPATIGYVEAHGTGTALGDPVELAALAEAFGDVPRGSCAIGSAKANIGHLETAAGVAGLIKVVEALRHRQLPPSVNFDRPNPAIGFETSPFYVNRELRGWDADGAPRRACLSSFGLGGTNAHIVLEEAPEIAPAAATGTPELLLVSARSADALDKSVARLAARLAGPAAPALADAAFTLACGREHHPFRRFAVARPGEQAGQFQRGTPAPAAKDPRLAFVIPGQGIQAAGMAAAAYAQPAFRAALDECLQAMGAVGTELREMLLAGGTAAAIDRTEYAQPAIFATSYASAKLWQSYGLVPDLLIGHSLGEYVAACLAGVFTLPDAARLVVERARLMQAQPSGAMAAVQMAEADLQALLAEHPEWGCDIAGANAPAATVATGGHQGIASLIAAVGAAGGQARLLRTSHAFHSRMMDGVLAPFEQAAARVPLQAPAVPVVSSLTGKLLTDEQATSPRYWADQLRGTVRFADGMGTALGEGISTFLDIGPSATATALALANAASSGARVIGGFPDGDHEAGLLKALGAVWAAGHAVSWKSIYAERGCRRVELPAYPFEKRRCWIEPVPRQATAVEVERVEAPAAAASSGVHSEAPAGDYEALVAAIWQELLGVEFLSADDNFFALGGQSLLATRVITRIHEETGVELPVRAIFDSPTVAGLAAALLEQRAAEEDPELLARLLAEIELDAAGTA